MQQAQEKMSDGISGAIARDGNGNQTQTCAWRRNSPTGWEFPPAPSAGRRIVATPAHCWG